MMKRSFAACVLAAVGLGLTGVAPAFAAAPKQAGCPAGGWVGPSTTLQVAEWWNAQYGDGSQGTTDSVDAYLQQRSDLDDDGFVCYKVMPQERLPEQAQLHNSGIVIITDARSSAR